MRRIFLLFICLFSTLVGKLPDLTPQDVLIQVKEILKMHATYKELNPIVVKRILVNFIEELDPTKTYFIESDIKEWLEPSDQLVNQIQSDFYQARFPEFEKIYAVMVKAIERRRAIDKSIDLKSLPKGVKVKEFKDMKWAETLDELKIRVERVKALQIESAMKLIDEVREKSLQRMEKRQQKFEDEVLNPNPLMRERLILTDILKATASALDTHTVYFTPEEAQQFMIGVQQRLFGIGAQLRDDLNGFAITKIVEGGPAAHSKELKVGDRIIAVNSEPVVGMEITEAVELIRGEEYTPVTLTIIRQVPVDASKPDGEKKDEKKDITILRGEVVLNETRIDTSYEPYGDGVIGYIHLYSFYQDPDSSSSDDLEKAIKKLKSEHKVYGIILDLRFNSGGLLSQAVGVTGLFITKGTVVSIKDDTGAIQHLRDLGGKMAWDGPLIVLINRASASASEIVAQSLQDYGRALVVGDDHSYGKGSFQTFTLNTTSKDTSINPKGEYKVTRGKYYTVSGETPQLNGVKSNIIIPGPLSEAEVGEKYSKYPLQADSIKPNFDDDLSDIPFYQRDKIRALYKFDLQKQLTTYQPYIEILRKNSAYRLEHDKNYQNFLKEIKKNDNTEEELDPEKEFGQNDLQLYETYNVMKDLVFLMKP